MVGLNERFGWSIPVSRTLVEVAALVSGWALGGSVGVGTVVFAISIGPLDPRLVPPPAPDRSLVHVRSPAVDLAAHPSGQLSSDSGRP